MVTDHELDPVHFHSINREFYAEEPTQYFKTRLALLLALCDPSHPLDDVLRAGATFAEISVTSPAPTSVELEGFATIETLSLEHLVSETLVRLYFAHLDTEYCPPLKMAGLTNFRSFKARVRDKILDAEPTEEWVSGARRVFRGSDDPAAFPDLNGETMSEDGKHLTTLLKHAATTLLAGGNAYNSLKHGFGVQPSRPSLIIGTPNTLTGVLLDHNGPAISYLHKKTDENGGRVWARSTSFISIEISLATVVMMIDEIDSLWRVARMSYLGESATVNFQPSGRIRALYKKHSSRGIQRLTWSATYPRRR